MDLRGDVDYCDACGAVVTVPLGDRPRTLIASAPGEPIIRLIMVGTVEIHRCEI